MGALPGIELPGGVPRTCLGGQVRGMCRAAEEIGHRVVGRLAIGADGDICPAYGVALGLES